MDSPNQTCPVTGSMPAVWPIRSDRSCVFTYSAQNRSAASVYSGFQGEMNIGCTKFPDSSSSFLSIIPWLLVFGRCLFVRHHFLDFLVDGFLDRSRLRFRWRAPRYIGANDDRDGSDCNENHAGEKQRIDVPLVANPHRKEGVYHGRAAED